MLSMMEEISVQRLFAKLSQREEVLEEDMDTEDYDLTVEDDDWGNDF